MATRSLKPAQAGMTLAELLVVLVAVLMILTVAAAYSVPGAARESMRGAVYDVQTCLQLARAEAITRNRECRCVVDTAFGTIQTFDTLGTADRSDDLELYESELPAAVVLGRPDAGPVITLAQIDGSDRYHTVFSSDGGVSDGQGDVYLFGGERFGRITVFGVGATRAERWDGGAWTPGL